MRLLASTIIASIGLFLGAASSQGTESYWLKVVGGNSITNDKLLRTNNTYSPGITNPPYSAADHFLRLALIPSTTNSSTTIEIVPTNPHPGPIAGYLALNGTTSPTDANDFVFELLQTWHPDDPLPDGYTLKLPDWEIVGTEADGRKWLRYKDGGRGRWVAVLGRHFPFYEFDSWVPSWIGPGSKQAELLEGKQVVSIDLEVAVADPTINS